MNEANGTSRRINDENGAAIRDINPESDATLICDETIGTIETAVFLERLPNQRVLVPMHLLSRGERHSAKPETLAKIPMNLIQPGQRLRSIGDNINPVDSANESVPNGSESLQGGEKFQR
jgi:hypothetical protein